jgi:hypothetical protein
MIHGPKDNGTYVVEFRTVLGDLGAARPNGRASTGFSLLREALTHIRASRISMS